MTHIKRPYLSEPELGMLLAHFLGKHEGDFPGLDALGFSLVSCLDADTGATVRVSAQTFKLAALHLLSEKLVATTVCRWTERSARKLSGTGWLWFFVEIIRRWLRI